MSSNDDYPNILIGYEFDPPAESDSRDESARDMAAGRPGWERAFQQVYEHTLWSDDTTRALFEFDPEEVPAFVIERYQDALDDRGVFPDMETVPDALRGQLEAALRDSLEARHGWSIRSIRENLQEAVPALDEGEAEVVARTETQALTAAARERGYREEFDLDRERFYWTGPSDSRTTEACEWLKERTHPDHGGEPVLLGRLRELVGEANRRFVDGHDAREYTPHIQCRHTFVRAV